MEDKKNKFVFYLFNTPNHKGKKGNPRLRRKTSEVKNQYRKWKKELNDLIDNSVSDDLNKLSHDIFYVNEQYEKINTVYATIDLSQKNQIKTKFSEATEYNRDICGQKIDLEVKEVLLMYQVFAAKILYVIYINNRDELEDYVKKNDLTRKFDILYKEFLKAIFGFKTKDDVLNFLFKKMLNTEHKDAPHEIDTMKKAISDCVDLLSKCEEKRFFVISDEVEAENVQIAKERKYIAVNWGKDIGKLISLRQIKDVSNVIEKNDNQKFDKIEDKIENELLFSHKTLLSRLDKTNKNADENLFNLVEYYFNLRNNQDENNIFEKELKYLENVIKNEVCSLKERFIVNNVLKKPWSTDKSYEFDNFLQKLCDYKFITCDYLGMFKYEDEDGNLYTHNFVLKNLSYFFTNLHTEKKEMDINKLRIKPGYEKDFKDIKIKQSGWQFDEFNRKEMLEPIFLACKNSVCDEVVEEAFCSCLKFIPIEQLLKTRIDYHESKENQRYLCDFDRLNDLNDEMSNVDNMVSRIMAEATIKNFGNENELENKAFSKSKLFEIVSKKLKDGTISIRANNHTVIEKIFGQFKFDFYTREKKYDDYVILNAGDYKDYFAMCCNLVKELCVRYKDKSEIITFITYQLFGTMLDCARYGSNYDKLNEGSAEIVFELDESKSYKFTAEQQIGFLRICTGKINSARETSDYEESMIDSIRQILEFMLKQHKKIPLNQKTLDYLFLNISNVTCLSKLIDHIDDHKFNFNLGLNVVEHIFNLFIDDQNKNDSQKQKHLCKLVNCIILNNNINFISSDQKQNDEIKNAQENHKQIRLNFIKMYLAKIKGNKKLISAGILNSFFKYFNDSLEIKKEIARNLISSGFKFTKCDILEVLNETQRKDKAELKKIFGVEMYFKSDDEQFEREFINSDANEDKRSCKSLRCAYSNLLLKTKNINKNIISDNENPNLNGRDNSQIFTNEIKTTDLQNGSSNNINNVSESQEINVLIQNNHGKTKAVTLAYFTQKESFFNRNIYFAIALIIIVVVLTVVFKEPVILFVLLVPVIIFLYRCFKKRKKNNPKRKKLNPKNYESNQEKSLIEKTKNITSEMINENEKIIFDGNIDPRNYIDSLDGDWFE